jgi:predicted RNA binding protein YcfA (HicA-like mRNA interferase family)
MQIRQQTVETSLERKGFLRSPGDHRFFTYYSKAGKKTIVFTKTSHGSREIGDHLIAQMARQCKLNKGQFVDLIECPLSRDQYEDVLIEKNIALT